MAKYVLLAFESDDDANEFIVSTQHYGGVEVENKGTDGFDLKKQLTALVRGVWKMPTKFCECGPVSGPFTRGRKYGWWVHAKKGCNKPTRGWAKGDHWHQALGVNLLPISEVAPEHRGPDHIKHPGYQPTANFCNKEGRFKFGATPGGPCPSCNDGTELTLSPIHRNKED